MSENKLIRLDNGSWIDPTTVIAIQILPQVEGLNLMDRVMVLMSDGRAVYIDCKSDTDALMEADKLAVIVNEAR